MQHVFKNIYEGVVCWVREKKTLQKVDSFEHLKALYDNKYCGSCTKVLEEEQIIYLQKAKIKKKNFQFCSEECYEEWLQSPECLILSGNFPK